MVLSSVVMSVATFAVAVAFGVALIRSRDGDVTVGAQFWQVVGAVFVVMAAYAVIGVAIGALVRNQIVAVVGVLVWMLVVEQLLTPTFPTIGRCLPPRWARPRRLHGRGGSAGPRAHAKAGRVVRAMVPSGSRR
jgi:ABC-2 type transport system permease protein